MGGFPHYNGFLFTRGCHTNQWHIVISIVNFQNALMIPRTCGTPTSSPSRSLELVTRNLECIAPPPPSGRLLWLLIIFQLYIFQIYSKCHHPLLQYYDYCWLFFQFFLSNIFGMPPPPSARLLVIIELIKMRLRIFWMGTTTPAVSFGWELYVLGFCG